MGTGGEIDGLIIRRMVGPVGVESERSEARSLDLLEDVAP